MSNASEKLPSPILSAALTLAVPGLGHFYQGRYFKGALYSICILGTFLFGMRLGDGKVLYFDWHPERRTWPYVCQFFAGVAAWPAILQWEFRTPADFSDEVEQPFSSSFAGTLDSGTLKGTIDFKRNADQGFPSWEGNVSGTFKTADGEFPVRGKLTEIHIDWKVAPDAQRRLAGQFEGQVEGSQAGLRQGWFEGSLPRSIVDSYGAPLRDKQPPNRLYDGDQRTDLARAHAQLGARFELGVLYTMVAGLLNVLAIWDNLEGPAYESQEEDEDPADGTPGKDRTTA